MCRGQAESADGSGDEGTLASEGAHAGAVGRGCVHGNPQRLVVW
jgi:hypothetical protein